MNIWADHMDRLNQHLVDPVLGPGSVPVLYAPVLGGSKTVYGLFDEDQVNVPEGGSEQLAPKVQFRSADLPDDPEADDADPLLTIKGRTFRVKDADSDDFGMITLYLFEVQE